MDTGKKAASQFEFRKSLKEDAKYPILNYFRVERYFTRPLASLLVRAVFNTPITPNHITYLSFFPAFFAAVFYCFGQPRYFIIAGILTQLSSVFDCADGMLARSKNMCSQFGAYLDLFLDRISDFIVLCGIAVGYYIYADNLTLFIINIFAIVLYFLQVCLYYIMQNFKQDKKPGQSAEARGLSIFIIFLFSVLNRLDILIYFIILEVTINVAVKILSFVRLSRR